MRDPEIELKHWQSSHSKKWRNKSLHRPSLGLEMILAYFWKRRPPATTTDCHPEWEKWTCKPSFGKLRPPHRETNSSDPNGSFEEFLREGGTTWIEPTQRKWIENSLQPSTRGHQQEGKTQPSWHGDSQPGIKRHKVWRWKEAMRAHSLPCLLVVSQPLTHDKGNEKTIQ
jgi:hypothetical protein